MPCIRHVSRCQGLGGASTTLFSDLKRENLDQTMPKNEYFLEKSCKIAALSGAPPPNSRWPPAAGGYASRPPLCFQFKGFQRTLLFLL